MNLNDLLETSLGHDKHKRDYVSNTHDIRFELNSINLPGALFSPPASLGMNDHALQQACTKLGPPPYRYMKECPPILKAANLNHWREELRKAWMVRAYGDTARAVLSPDYSPISNSFVIQQVMETVTGPYKLMRPYVDPDTLHLKIIVADDTGGNHGIGAYIGNGETGNRQIRVTPLIQRHSCENSIIAVDGGWSQRHWKVSPEYVAGSIKEKIGHALGVAADLLGELVKAQMDQIPSFTKVVDQLAKDKGILPYKDLILMGSETEQNRMGLVHGLSFAAKHADPELAVDLESMAGALLMGAHWTQLRSYEGE